MLISKFHEDDSLSRGALNNPLTYVTMCCAIYSHSCFQRIATAFFGGIVRLETLSSRALFFIFAMQMK